MIYKHIPVMTEEVLSYLNCRPGGIYVDCTLGGSGHARRICEKIMPGGLLIGIDQDADAVANAEKVLQPYHSNIRLIQDNFANLSSILIQHNISKTDGILIDPGASLYHFDQSGRGFGFDRDEPLDMRMDIRSSGLTADEIINHWEEKELKKLFKTYGEERFASLFARKIIEKRAAEPIRSSRQLSDIIINATPKKALYQKPRHPATKVFMALRIMVNDEIERLSQFMETVDRCLKPGGRLCALSFHSLEDRIIKHRIKNLEKECTCPPGFPKCVCNGRSVVRNLTKKPVRPSPEERDLNPMSRSTKLRAMEKL